MSKLMKFWAVYQLVQYVMSELRRIFDEGDKK